MKIAILNLYQNIVSRGAETYVQELSKRLSKKNQVDIIFGDKLPPKRYPILWRAYLDLQGICIAFFTLKQLPLLWKNKYDIIMPTNGGWQPALVRILTWIRGGRMIIPGFSGIGWDDRNNLWSFPDRFVALSTRAKIWAKKANPLVKVEYIPGGVDLAKFSPEEGKLGIGLKEPVILCVGALEPQKRLKLVIRAVAKMKKASLLIVGDGKQKGEIKKLGEKLLGSRFQLKKIKYEEMPKVYRVADVFTLVPEGSEAFGIVYLEAMATNLPVVAIDDDQRREIIGNAGILIDPTDIDVYAKALNRALETNWGDKPRCQAKKFSWDKITKEYEKLFKRIIK